MLLYVIRHGDPDYAHDCLTELGKAQAEALARRMAGRRLSRIYASPRGRAIETAEPTCRLTGLSYTVEPWMDEDLAWADFSIPGPDGQLTWPFQLPSADLRSPDNDKLGESWYKFPCFSGKDPRKGFARIARHSDEFLERLGYRREGTLYRILRPSEERVAAFCHQGFGMMWMAFLLHLPPLLFWAGFDIAHTGVTLIRFGNDPDGLTAPRCLFFSDLSHLYEAGLPLRYNDSVDV